MGESASHNIYGFTQNRMLIDLLGFYGADIHFLRMYDEAKGNGYSLESAYLFACGSLAPDLGKYDAVQAGKDGYLNALLIVGTWSSGPLLSFFCDPNEVSGRLIQETSQLKEYQQVLHNLNGFNPKQLSNYKCCLECLFHDTKDYYQKGVIAHVLGDTYAHTYLTEDNQMASIGNNLMLGHTWRSIRSAVTGDRFSDDPDNAYSPGNRSRSNLFIKHMQKILRSDGYVPVGDDFPLLLGIYLEGKKNLEPPTTPNEAKVDAIYPKIKSCFESAKGA